ncbi:MAG: hypothetical protein OEY14_07500, partial [Myxococcales bacterium]|nr:hypothetical protein [Myxococcales bacterium]
YLGQSEVPDGSDAYQEAPSRELGGAHAVDEIYRRLLLPWRPEEIRGGWALAEMSRPGGGEDGLVRYLFRRHEGPAEATVAIRLAPRNQDRPCFARTPGHNVFYDAGEGVEGRRVEELLRVVVRLVRRNEARLSGAAKRAGQSA